MPRPAAIPEATYIGEPMSGEGNGKKALITGISGQDGSYLAELLLERGYEVHGIIRRSSSFNTDRIDHLYHDPHEQGVRLFTHYGDLADATALIKLLYELQVDEIYHLGAQSHVRVSFEIPEYTFDVTAAGTLRLLEAMREAGVNPRFYQASSSEMFGAAPPPQNEATPFHPRSPYGCAKVFGHDIVVNYRESYGLFACSGILFNHEGPRRGIEFVTRKVTKAVARIKLGLQDELVLGNLDSKRDWGYAGDYVRAMWLMLQQPEPDDFVIATGKTHSIEELVERAFAEVDLLIGDATKARAKLGWEPTVTFEDLVSMMVTHDLGIESAKAGLAS